MILRFRQNYPNRQQGAALLILVLLLLIAASYALVTRLGAVNTSAYQDDQTIWALAQAKEALLGYAAAYPEMASSPPDWKGPGYLPCPDSPINDTDPTQVGMASTNCRLSTGTSLGRLPWRYLGLPDLRDGSGERLWYAVSDNFNYNGGVVPMNSDTPGDIVVDGKSDIVAVIIAPGGALGDQLRSTVPGEAGYSTPSDYLEDENADPKDKKFVSKSTGDFDDIVSVITRTELMGIVEKRVMGAVAHALTNFRIITPPVADPNSRYPWLMPFTDPKLVAPLLTGTASTIGNSTQLNDNTQDFTSWDIQTGDIVLNLTDGSNAQVSAAPAAASLTVTPLIGGTSNIFQANDRYVVIPSATSDRLKGTAGAGTGKDPITGEITLIDTARNFGGIGVVAGDIIENIPDGSRGLVDGVGTNSVTIQSSTMVGGTSNSFSTGNLYTIRSNSGTAPLSTVAFANLGINIGDPIENLTTRTLGYVTSVSGSNVSTSNIFNNGDYYRVPRFTASTATGVNQGLLSFHEPGKLFRTAFTVGWNLSAYTPTTNIVGVPPPPAILTTAYANAITSSIFSGPISIPITGGACVWTVVNEADCQGSTASQIVTGNAAASSSGISLTDTTQNFAAWGVVKGDRIRNLSDGSYGVISAVSPTTLNVFSLNFGTNNAFTSGDRYQVNLSTDSIQGTVKAASSSGSTNAIAVTGLTTADVKQYDVLEDLAGTSAFGLVETVVPFPPNFLLITYSGLQGGSNTSFSTGDSFRLWRGWVDNRTWSFQIKVNGIEQASFTTSGERKRSVLADNVTLPVESAPYTVKIQDKDTLGISLATSTIKVDATGSGTLDVTDMDFNLMADGTSGAELPAWFTSNDWQRFMYVAVAPGLGPNGSGSCTPGMDCLTLNKNTGLAQTPPGAITVVRNDVQALVIATGAALTTSDLTQDRTVGCANTGCVAKLLPEYLEGENAVTTDNVFYEGIPTSSFNDQVRIVSCATSVPSPCP